MLIDRLTTPRQTRGNPENPSTGWAEVADILDGDFDGGGSSSGVRVNANTALRYHPMWRGVQLLSYDTARLGAFVFKRTEHDGRERDRAHKWFRSLRFKPNPVMSSFDLWAVAQSHKILHGNGYIYIARGTLRRPPMLIPLLPHRVKMVNNGGRWWYLYSPESDEDGNPFGEPLQIPPGDVLHAHGIGADGTGGYGLIDKARDALGLEIAAERYSAKFFNNSSRPPVIIEHPGKPKEEAVRNLLKSWSAMYGGVNNAHKTAVLPGGAQAKVLGIDAKASQLLESREFGLIVAANLIGIPPHKLGHPARTSFNSLESEGLSYLNDLDNHLVPWELELNCKLLTEPEQANDTHFIEFNRLALLRVDLAARTAHYDKAANRWMTANEIRQRENLPWREEFEEIAALPGATPPAGDDSGDDSTDEDSLPAETDDSGDETKARMARLRAAHMRILGESATKIAKDFGSKARRMAKKGGKAYWSWVDNEADSSIRGVFLGAIADPCEAISSSGASDRADLAAEIVELCVDRWRSLLMGAADVKESELVASVDTATERIASEASTAAVGMIGDTHEGH